MEDVRGGRVVEDDGVGDGTAQLGEVLDVVLAVGRLELVLAIGKREGMNLTLT